MLGKLTTAPNLGAVFLLMYIFYFALKKAPPFNFFSSEVVISDGLFHGRRKLKALHWGDFRTKKIVKDTQSRLI